MKNPPSGYALKGTAREFGFTSGVGYKGQISLSSVRA
jgi:hypothetical protein